MKKINIFAVPALLLLIFNAGAQKINWQNLDLKDDGVFGISTEKIYSQLLKNKKPQTVIVAVIDSGIDTSHVELKNVLWTNKNEIPGNGVDDDHNGYIDDVHGWNYIGSEVGKEDITQIVLNQKNFYDSLAYSKVPEEYKSGYRSYRKLLDDYNGHLNNAEYSLYKLAMFRLTLDSITSLIGKKSPSLEDLKNFRPLTPSQDKVRLSVIERLPYYKSYGDYVTRELEDLQETIQFHIDNALSLKNRKTQTESNASTSNRYGDNNINNDLEGPVDVLNLTSFHGTHVAGIIAADRSDGTPMKGIADHAQIMMLKVLSSVRELRDKDLASAIRYAVKNGAKVINLSFGKPYSPFKASIDSAIKYAMQNDVLFIVGAGNQGENLDEMEQFPTRFYLDKTGKAEAWIEVGASGLADDTTLMASFSNYGKSSVDVFAPGVRIYSCIPGSRYEFESGTSMATPVVAGLAALIREYYPKLTAVQVRDIIIKSVEKREVLKNKCSSGGVVNGYNALKLADTYK